MQCKDLENNAFRLRESEKICIYIIGPIKEVTSLVLLGILTVHRVILELT